MGRTRHRRRQAGFTLMETLVSIMIIAVSLAIVLQVFSGGLHAGRLTYDYTRAVFLAREKMELVLLNQNLQPGSLNGETEDGYRWAAQIALIDDVTPMEQMPVYRLGVNVNVNWQDGSREKHYQLYTVTLATKPNQGK